MSLALYRKYRPATFAAVIGQEHVTGPICTALDSGRIHHAYLFSGPRGCGKTSSARILARSLNCDKGPTSTPCEVCDSCVALAPMGPGSLDVIEIDAASHGLVDDARDLRERAFFAPVSSRFKIYVIDEAHMITNAAFNALLKVVEEPPPHVKFIFATTEPDKVLTTIKSRTFHYRFRLIPPQIMREHLATLCESEGIQVDPLVLPLIVRAGAGSARDSQSILDQLAAGSGADGISYDRALALLGYTDAALLDEVVDAFAAGDGAAVFRSIDRVIEAGLEPRRFAQDLLERFRDLLVLDAVPDAASSGLIDAPTDELERMAGQASRSGRPSLSRAADVMAAALVEMRGTTSPRLVLELASARVLLPGAASDTAALLARLDTLERRMAAGVVAAGAVAAGVVAPGVVAAGAVAPPLAADPVAASDVAPAAASGSSEPAAQSAPDAEPAVSAERVEPVATAERVEPVATAERLGSAGESADARVAAAGSPEPPVAAPVVVAGSPEPPVAAPVVVAGSPEPPVTAPVGIAEPAGLDLAALRQLWDPVLDAVKQRSRTAHALMFSATIESLEQTTLTLSFSTPTLANRFASDVVDFVVAALKEVLGVDLTLRTTSRPPSAAAADAAARAVTPAAVAAASAPLDTAAAAPTLTASPTSPPSSAPRAESPRTSVPRTSVPRTSVPRTSVPRTSTPTADRFTRADSEADADADPDGDVDITGDDSAPLLDPTDAALALVKEGLGGQVIGEIDRS